MNKKAIDLYNDIMHELQNLETLADELKTVKDFDSLGGRRMIGSILHDSYNCCERIFRLIVGEINGAIPFGHEWHRQLLNKVIYDVKDVRPAIVSKELASELEEYLEFRHVFRNIYGFELLGDRLIRLKDKHNNTFNKFSGEIKKFLAWMSDQKVENKDKKTP